MVCALKERRPVTRPRRGHTGDYGSLWQAAGRIPGLLGHWEGSRRRPGDRCHSTAGS